MSNQKADKILSSNTVFTGLMDKPQPASIAIIDNKIEAIGSEEEIKQFIGPDTEVYHYDNQIIMPGFHDNHLHIMMGSISLDSVNLFEARSEIEAVEMVRQFADSKPDEPWILGYTWDAGYWDNKQLPHRSSLDKVIPNRPVILFHAEGHYAWVNTKALEMMNIDRDTDNPPFGIIEKDENGELTGILYEKAMSLVTKEAYHLSKQKKTAIFENFLRHASSLGVTSINDLYGTESMEVLDDYQLFKEFDDNDKLTVRIHLWPALNGDIERAKQLRERYASEKLIVSGLKQFIDGVITARTAYLLEPYADEPQAAGDTSHPPETMKEWVIKADKEGFDIRFHAIGDGAIRLALDSFENAQKENGVRDSRHSIEHVEVIHPDDISRFKQLGVIASMQPNHLAMSERSVYTSRIGKEREKLAFVINTLKESDAISFGTDFPIDGLNPLIQIYRAITRIDSSGVSVWNPEEKITLSNALKAYTNGPAYSTNREHELGTLEAGKLADIVVLDRNLFDVPTDEILDTKVKLTMINGDIVYNSDIT
ncbi:amidohydrolase [Alteribacillus sp. YIM 98480]|uniref:amidohydrolase n=1 Tax=Alteribacillus sp. YIM 98480 TaxID=2606599 RepID=UPI00131B24EF|nr:amidohydrolase [Alteribacillus sp. YIM 98480]